MKEMVSQWINDLRIEGKPDEWESKNLLKMMGLNVELGRRIMPGESVKPDDFKFPLALKVCDPDILHKTESGGVRLNVKRDNFEEVLGELRRIFPSSPLLADPMCSIVGPEFILGGMVDPVFGPAVMVGAGGVLTEIYEDAVFRLCPCSKGEALRMLNELKIAPVLKGYRDSPLSMDELADEVSRLSELFDAFDGKLNQIDINPMVYTGENWTALDCVFILNT